MANRCGAQPGDRQRRALPPARPAQPCGVRRHRRALLGIADRSPAMRRRRRWRWCGAGNSAGQAVVYLAGQARKVWMVVRGAGAGSHHVAISDRTHPRLAQCRTVDRGRKFAALEGENGMLEDRALAQPRRAARRPREPIGHLFLFIGADPNTDWLEGCGIALDGKDFVLTGGDGRADAGDQPRRRVRDRRCPQRLGQAGRGCRGRRGAEWWRRCMPSWPRTRIEQAAA